MLYQQGDILIEAVDRLPEKIWPLSPEKGRYILSKGEATGHAHAVAEPVRLYFSGNDDLFCAADNSFTVRHEEHLPITIPAGLYTIRKVREFDYFQADNIDAIHPVQD